MFLFISRDQFRIAKYLSNKRGYPKCALRLKLHRIAAKNSSVPAVDDDANLTPVIAPVASVVDSTTNAEKRRNIFAKLKKPSFKQIISAISEYSDIKLVMFDICVLQCLF